jgi:POT family proton-dependent oligopeptide transporter
MISIGPGSTEATDAGDPGSVPNGGRWRLPWQGHPRGLLSLAGVELWERFSFYGLQVILAYYLYYSLTEGGLGLSQQVAVGIAGAYGGVICVSQLVGGWVADRLVAPRVVVLVSAILITVGDLALAFVPGITGVGLGLALIVLGTGGLKVNVAVMVGMLYPGNGAMRDSAYSLYYMGISIGACLGPVLTGILQSSVGFRIAFAGIAVAMAVGLMQYVAGYKHLPQVTRTVPNPLPRTQRAIAGGIATGVIAAVALAVAGQLITLENISTVVTAVVVVAAVTYFAIMLSGRRTDTSERSRVLVYIPIFLSTLLFWTLLFQLFTTLAVYMDTRVDLRVAGVSIPPAVVITVQSLFAAALAPLYATLWDRLGPRQPNVGAKIFGGIALMAAGFVIFAMMANSTGASNPVAVVLVALFLFGAGEIAVVPSALSATAALAPKAFTSQMMGMYFLTMAGGSTVSGLIAQRYDPATELTFFGAIAITGLILSAVLYAAYKALSRRV